MNGLVLAAPRSLDEACGTSPSLVCRRVYEITNGNDDLTEFVDWLLHRPLRIVVIIAVAFVLTRLSRRWVRSAVRQMISPDRASAVRQLRRAGIDDPDSVLNESAARRRESRSNSISGVMTSTLNILIWVIAGLLILGELGVNLGPFIAGAGIAGIALGFGAQSLVKDCIAGLFMLIEDQYGLGDVIDLGEAVGEVEDLSLRATVLRGLDGTVWHVPNGEVKRVGNKSQLWSIALVDIDVAYHADLDATRDLMIATAHDVCASPAWRAEVLDEPVVLGVEALGADGVTMRMVVKTMPGAQWALQRELREAFKATFDEAGIEIPFPQRTVWLRGTPDE